MYLCLYRALVLSAAKLGRQGANEQLKSDLKRNLTHLCQRRVDDGSFQGRMVTDEDNLLDTSGHCGVDQRVV